MHLAHPWPPSDADKIFAAGAPPVSSALVRSHTAMRTPRGEYVTFIIARFRIRPAINNCMAVIQAGTALTLHRCQRN